MLGMVNIRYGKGAMEAPLFAFRKLQSKRLMENDGLVALYDNTVF